MLKHYIKNQNKTLIINTLLVILPLVASISSVKAQNVSTSNPQQQEIYKLIEQYNQARENKDVTQLQQILTNEVDQLVSSGEWRRGVESSIEGMLQSSNRNQGTRTISIESIRFLTSDIAIVDTRYQIELQNNTRNLWSTFIVTRQNNEWKITAIRNMSPTGNP